MAEQRSATGEVSSSIRMTRRPGRRKRSECSARIRVREGIRRGEGGSGEGEPRRGSREGSDDRHGKSFDLVLVLVFELEC